MKIGLHGDQLDHRGISTVLYDYSMGVKNILGYEPFIVSSRPKSTHPMERFSKFGYYLYEDPSEIPAIIDREKIDVFYMAKAGNRDTITPTNCKTAVHCIFDMREQHGTVYAGVSEWLAQHFGQKLWVPHIIDTPKISDTLHSELSIPNNAFIIGRHGGFEQFDLPFVHSAIKRALEQRSDLWAVFLNTKPFIDHPRVKFIPFQVDPLFKSKFINTCDAMIHARSDGETFGLAIAEFSSMNKPIITFDAPYWWYMRAHIHMLREKAITYKNEEELLSHLLQIDKEYVKDVDWDCYTTKFSPQNVMNQYKQVFLS